MLKSHGQEQRGTLKSHGQEQGGMLKSHGQEQGGTLKSHGQEQGGTLKSHGQEQRGTLKSHGQEARRYAQVMWLGAYASRLFYKCNSSTLLGGTSLQISSKDVCSSHNMASSKD
jgi:hypothetical protein